MAAYIITLEAFNFGLLCTALRYHLTLHLLVHAWSAHDSRISIWFLVRVLLTFITLGFVLSLQELVPQRHPLLLHCVCCHLHRRR